METAVALGIALHRVDSLIAFFIKQTACFFKLAFALYKVIVIHKVIPRVIGWIYVNHLYFTEISLAQYFQYIKVISFNVKVLCIIKVHALLTAWAKRHRGGCICQAVCLTLIWPSKLVTFLTLDNYLVRQFRL